MLNFLGIFLALLVGLVTTPLYAWLVWWLDRHKKRIVVAAGPGIF